MTQPSDSHVVESVYLIAPCGGSLVDLLARGEEAAELRARAAGLASVQLSQRALCDLELLAIGGFSPLDRFMGQADHDRVVEDMRLASGQLFPIPIALPVPTDSALRLDTDIALRDKHNDLLAIMTVEEIYRWSADAVSQRVLGTTDLRHPLVAEMRQWGGLNIAGRLKVVSLPTHPDYRHLRLSPAETRARLVQCGRANVVAFQTRNPLHRVHEELTKRAMNRVGGALLLHPVIGMTKPGDVESYTRVRTYETLTSRYYDVGTTVLALLPLAMRMAGPREALWHALIRRNYGASHFIVGRHHASPGHDSVGRPFYGQYDAQELVARFSDEVGVRMLSFRELAYLPDERRYEEVGSTPAGATVIELSGTLVRGHLSAGRSLPEWLTRPEVAAILADAHPPRHRQGVCVWFTGLSGAGKSATAQALSARLLEHGRKVTLLDGDVVRTHLSKDLGFSKEDRDANVRRVGFIASEIVRHGGVVICALISPYRAARDEVRLLFGDRQFVEVLMDTPLEVCQGRDSKGMYAKARRGEIPAFTGVDDPYEAPLAAEIALETIDHTVDDNAQLILDYLTGEGFVRSQSEMDAPTDTKRNRA